MNITLTPELEKLVEAEVAAGAYSSNDDVVNDALRERYRRKKLAELVEAAARGDASIEAGRFMEAGQAFAHIRSQLGLPDPSEAK